MVVFLALNSDMTANRSRIVNASSTSIASDAMALLTSSLIEYIPGRKMSFGFSSVETTGSPSFGVNVFRETGRFVGESDFLIVESHFLVHREIGLYGCVVADMDKFFLDQFGTFVFS